ncbi:hypothetical protein SAMN04487969_114173 [Paenibacillus algorifonticola]|uniref:Coat F domain-containing protein n=1 Tax=Paenibacillus algorifonticola TaxID=684063 RepID=A0A1I2G4B4_9BACL|nr:hypothetical protein [Paenibacillus algorifonticola]SFF12534.1 hypothetical protein SAMN04487969_114173 [Paenibacillus algorifonticola]
MLQPMTAKELEYVADSMSNEDLLIKQCTAVSVGASNQQLRQMCSQMLHTHQQHYQTLLHTLQQHQSMAPTQPQQ